MDNSLTETETNNDYLIYLYAKPNKQYTCCNLVFVDHSSFAKHYKKEHANVPLSYKCDKCNEIKESMRSVSAQYIHCTGIQPPPPAPKQHQCQYCEKSFDKANGLGQHMRKMHPREHEAVKDVRRVKVRWTNEELEMLSYYEANLPEGTLNVNQALQAFFPERTIESIKGQRNKNRLYRGYLDRHRLLATEPDSTADAEDEVVDVPRLEPDLESIQDAAILTTGDYPILQNILTRAFSGSEYENDLNTYIKENFTRQPKARSGVRRIIEPNDRRPIQAQD